MKNYFWTHGLLTVAAPMVAGQPSQVDEIQEPDSIVQGAAQSAEQMAELMDADPEMNSSGAAALARMMAEMNRTSNESAEPATVEASSTPASAQ